MNPKLKNATSLYIEGILQGHAREAVTKYTGAKYIQHSTGVRDGVEGFVAFFENFLARNPKREIQLVRTLVDGDHVFVQAYQSLNDGEYQYVTTDFFDTDQDDKIIEHWDVIALYAERTPSGHTSVDGPTEILDLEKTQENKALVRELITQLFMPGGDRSRIREFISEACFIQHSKDAPDGLPALEALLELEPAALVYTEIVLMVGQGNFVATLSRAFLDGQPLAQVDLFRLEGGRVVEHWDNSEPVPDPSEWVNSGKF
jgi:predicted SnoaL-like aldol condensation-catalyzing enzyme